MSRVRPSDWMDSQLAILPGKNFTVGHYTQTVQPNLFIPAMLIGTIDFYHFIQISKEALYGEYGSFEHLLFLSCVILQTRVSKNPLVGTTDTFRLYCV